MSARPGGYIPAAGRDWLLPLYDPILRILFPEEAAKRQLADEARIRARDRVLDIGCGTGTLALLVKAIHREARVIGIDGDSAALSIARKKAAKARLEVSFDEGLSYELPYPEASFERVLSSLVFHHLREEHKRRTLAEIYRVLVPGGVFAMLDFGRPVTAWDRFATRLLFRSTETRDNAEDRLAALIRESGLSTVEQFGRRGTLFGSIWYCRASKEAASISCP